MKATLWHLVVIGTIGLGIGLPAPAQEVRNTSQSLESKERVLRIESIVSASPKEVWKAFATEEGLKAWAAPVVSLDLRTGGSMTTHYDKNAKLGSPGTIRLGIVNYVEGEWITYKVSLTEQFAAKARAEDQNLQEIVQLIPWTNGSTKVISSMVGWGKGKEWDETYEFFAKGNEWTYKELVKSLSKKEK